MSGLHSGDQDAQLLVCLERGRQLGFLGPGEVSVHLVHARGFDAVADQIGHRPRRVVDLGSGGGVPALVCAVAWPDSTFWLVESQLRRAAFLQESVHELGLTRRVTVRHERAEIAGRDRELRGSMDTVIARSFGPPGVVAECGAPFLVVTGRVIVSEPPGSDGSRWPRSGLALLGLTRDGPPMRSGGHGYQVLRLQEECDDRFPRSVGKPAKRPIF